MLQFTTIATAAGNSTCKNKQSHTMRTTVIAAIKTQLKQKDNYSKQNSTKSLIKGQNRQANKQKEQAKQILQQETLIAKPTLLLVNLNK